MAGIQDRQGRFRTARILVGRVHLQKQQLVIGFSFPRCRRDW